MDIINEICSTTIFDYLVTSINDIDQFFRISGHTRRTINFDRLLQNLCMRNIKKYLQFDYLLDPKDFLIALHKSKGIISGGLVLHITSSNQRTPIDSDIDLYYLKNDVVGKNIMITYLESNQYVLNHSTTYSNLQSSNTTGPEPVLDNYKMLGGLTIETVLTFRKYNNTIPKQIQIIESRDVNISVDKIIESFDLTICQNKAYCENTIRNGDERIITYTLVNDIISFKPIFIFNNSSSLALSRFLILFLSFSFSFYS